MSWTRTLEAFKGLDEAAQAELDALPARDIPAHQILFRPGEAAQGFVVVLSGRVDVYLTGPSGREIILYSVTPGKTCVQTTLGLLGDEAYTGEAITSEPARLVMIPKPLFSRLMDESKPFRAYIFSAFGERLNDMMAVLERVAFHKVEARLAHGLLERAVGGEVSATQAELAAQIGSAREVVARQLDTFAKRGLVERKRGSIRLMDLAALERLAHISHEL